MSLITNNSSVNQESAQPQAPSRGLPPGAAQRALRGRGRGMPRR
jgi:T-complex protein 1 subunit eta